MYSMEPSLMEIGETAHALRRAFDRRATTLGVTRAQWRVLTKVYTHPDLRQVELADMLDVEPITLCRIVDRLEEAGLVERRRDPADRRAWQLRLTSKAKPLIMNLTQLAAELSAEAFAGLDEDEVRTMRRALAQVRANVATGQACRKAVGA